MANNLANSTSMFPQQPNPMMAMNTNNAGNMPFLMNPMMFNANQNSNLSGGSSIQNNSGQLAFQNAFF